MAFPKPPKNYYSVEEVAEELGWSVDDLISYGEQGKLEICREKITTHTKKLKSGTEIQKESYLPEVEPPLTPQSIRPYIEDFRDSLIILKGLSPDGKLPPTGLFITHEEKIRFEEDALKVKGIDKINPAEKKSLLKMVLAMAIDGYGYGPEDKKSPIPQQISDATAKIDMLVSDDTVRKWLKEASKLDKDKM